METALNAIETSIADFDTLWELFKFCFDSYQAVHSKYLDLVLSKASPAIKHKLLVNYEYGSSHNALLELLERDNTKENNAFMKVIFKHIDESKTFEVLNDEANPDPSHSALKTVCGKKEGNKEYFRMIQKMYEERKEDFEAELTKVNKKNESPLHLSITNGLCT